MITVRNVCDIAKEYVRDMIEMYTSNGDADSLKYWEGVSRDIDDLKVKIEKV